MRSLLQIIYVAKYQIFNILKIYIKYRMARNRSKGGNDPTVNNASAKNSGDGLFSAIGKLFGNNKSKEPETPAAPAAPAAPAFNFKPSASVNTPASGGMRGGMAPVNSYPSMNAQPSYGVMRWATTAGAAMPSAAEMRNVAHGGKRRKHRTHRRKSHKSRKSHKKTRSMKRKTHRRRHTKRRN